MSQVKVFSKRLKLSGAIVEQAQEYHRLAEVKCSSSLRAEPCLTLVCIDLACVKHGEPVDKVSPHNEYLHVFLKFDRRQ